MSASYERDTVEPRDAGADVKLPRYELVPFVTAAVELASGATLVQRCDEPVAMPFEERDRRLGFWRTAVGKPAEDGPGA